LECIACLGAIQTQAYVNFLVRAPLRAQVIMDPLDLYLVHLTLAMLGNTTQASAKP
jgi:hypothetical protein